MVGLAKRLQRSGIFLFGPPKSQPPKISCGFLLVPKTLLAPTEVVFSFGTHEVALSKGILKKHIGDAIQLGTTGPSGSGITPTPTLKPRGLKTHHTNLGLLKRLWEG